MEEKLFVNAKISEIFKINFLLLMFKLEVILLAGCEEFSFRSEEMQK